VIHPPLDSYGGIHKTDEEISQISKRRGGCGTDISHIRPKDTPTKNSSKKSTGIIPFMERFSNSIREVGQDGRRGALMLTLNVHHPEVLNFAQIKKDRSKITGANLSISLTDEFLKAVKANKDYEQRWPVEGPKKFSRMVNAREVWKKIIECAWDMAEPGLLFWDKIISESPADCYSEFGFKTVSTNPCSELPLSILDSCRLLFLNLFKFVKNPFTKNASFDFDEFYIFAQRAQRLMDDIVCLELESIDKIITKLDSDPEPEEVKARELAMWQEIRNNCFNGRRTGTGITALGDTLAAIGIGYGTKKSIEVTERIYQTLKFGCYRSSVDMAKELGPFPIWNNDLEKDNDFLNRMFKEQIETNNEDLIEITEIENGVEKHFIRGGQIMMEMEVFGRRNIALLTTAPVGSGSMLVELGMLPTNNIILHGSSSGIEPAFMLAYTRRKKINPSDKGSKVDFVDQNGDSWQEFPVYHPALKYWMEITGEKDISKSPWHGYCADDIDWKNRVKLQAAAQRHIDHAISSTINLPENVPQEKVAEIYEAAWEHGLKGITVYRKNCRSGVLVDLDSKQKDDKLVKRPKELKCDIFHIKVQEKEYFVLVGLDNKGNPYELLAAKNGKISKKAKHGKITKIKRGCYKLEADTGEILESVTDLSTDNEEAITRLVSTSLRSGVKIEYIVDQLEKVTGTLHCFAKSTARALKKYIKDGTKVHGEKCPECGDELFRQEGCKACKCGYTKCG
jgi:ribonucleoside-diphosphate reductase alpha chain